MTGCCGQRRFLSRGSGAIATLSNPRWTTRSGCLVRRWLGMLAALLVAPQNVSIFPDGLVRCWSMNNESDGGLGPRGMFRFAGGSNCNEL